MPRKLKWSFGYKEYTLCILTLVFATQYLDRQIIVVLTEPIKAEFALSDAQMGLLTGLIFSIPYCAMLLPVGVLVDRTNRRNLLLFALTTWSALTIVTGFVRHVWQLALIRAAIAAAESSNNPTALSMVADLYGPRKRATAVGVFYAGPAIASMIGFVAIAWIADNYGWRQAFFAAGAPGLLLAILIFLTIREPEREGSGNPELSTKPPLKETLAFIRSQKSAIHLMLAMMVVSIVSSGQLIWMVPSLMRGHGVSMTEAAFYVSLSFGLFNAAGHIFGGAVVDRMARSDFRWHAWGPGLFSLIGGAFMIGSNLGANVTVAVVLIALWALPIGCQYGPVLGAVQTLVKPRMRGVASAMLVFGVNLIGAGLGPLIVGTISDYLQPIAGQQSLQWSLASVSLLQIWAFCHFYFAARSLPKDLERMKVTGLTSL